MKIRFKNDCEGPEIGVVKKGDELDLDPVIERRLIERGVAVNISAPGYKSKSIKKKEVTENG